MRFSEAAWATRPYGEIAEAHGWSVAATPGTAGGARIVIDTARDRNGSAA